MSSALTKRFHKKLDTIPALCRRLTRKDAATIQKAFVEALKEEVESRWKVGYVPGSGIALDPNAGTPLVISGLGSFKMRTRPAKEFANPSFREEQAAGGPGEGDNELSPTVTKPPSRRLVFTSKWEPLDG